MVQFFGPPPGNAPSGGNLTPWLRRIPERLSSKFHYREDRQSKTGVAEETHDAVPSPSNY